MKMRERAPEREEGKEENEEVKGNESHELCTACDPAQKINVHTLDSKPKPHREN